MTKDNDTFLEGLDDKREDSALEPASTIPSAAARAEADPHSFGNGREQVSLLSGATTEPAELQPATGHSYGADMTDTRDP